MTCYILKGMFEQIRKHRKVQKKKFELRADMLFIRVEDKGIVCAISRKLIFG